MKYNLDYKTIGQQLKKRRELLGLTQEYVGNFVYGDSKDGKDRTKTIRNHESGQSFPFKILLRYCDVYDCDIGYLLGNYDESTHDLHFICSETGLSEDAVEILKNDNNGKCILTDIIDFLIKDSLESSSLMYNLLVCKLNDVEIEKYKSNKWFNTFSKIIDECTSTNEKENVIGLSLTTSNIDNATVNKIIDYLEAQGFSKDEILEISKETDNFFASYINRETEKEISKAILNNQITRYIDKYLF